MTIKVDIVKVPTEIGPFHYRQGFLFNSLTVSVKYNYVNDMLEDVGEELETEIILYKSMFDTRLRELEFDIITSKIDLEDLVAKKLNS